MLEILNRAKSLMEVYEKLEGAQMELEKRLKEETYVKNLRAQRDSLIEKTQ